MREQIERDIWRRAKAKSQCRCKERPPRSPAIDYLAEGQPLLASSKQELSRVWERNGVKAVCWSMRVWGFGEPRWPSLIRFACANANANNLAAATAAAAVLSCLWKLIETDRKLLLG